MNFYISQAYPPSFNGHRMQICNYLLYRGIVDTDSSDLTSIIVLTVIAIYLLYILFNLVLFYLKAKNNQDIPASGLLKWRNWKNIGHIHRYGFFLPVHNILLEVLVQILTKDSVSAIFCTKVISLIVALLVNIGLCVQHFSIVITIRTKDRLTPQSNVFLKICFLQRVFISTINLLILRQKVADISTIVLNFMYLALILTRSLSFIYTLPFFSKSVLNIFILEIGLLSCFTILNVIMNLFAATGHLPNNSFIIFITLILMPLYLKVAINFLKYRLINTFTFASRSLAESKTVFKYNRYWFIQSIYYMQSVLMTKMQPSLLSRHHKESLLLQIAHITSLYELISDRRAHFSEIRDVNKNLNILLVRFMNKWIKKHPKDVQIKIMLADAMINDFSFIYKSYTIIQELLHTNNHHSDLCIGALKVREDIQGALKLQSLAKSDKIGMTSFFEGSRYYDQLQIRIKSHLEKSNTFFQTIQNQNPSLYNIMKACQAVQAERKKVKIYWKMIPENLMESYTPLLLAYGVYRSCINFEYKKGNELIQRYYKLIKKRSQDKNTYEINEETFFSQSNVTILMNAAKKDFGKVRYCSENAESIIGEEAQKLIGKDIKTIMSPFFHKMHDKFIIKKLESVDTMSKSKYYATFAFYKQKYIYPVNILVSLFPWLTDGLFFSGIIRPIKTKLEYILLEEQGYIDSYSKLLITKLNLPNTSLGLRVHITDVCRAFENINQALNAVHLRRDDSRNNSTIHTLDTYSIGKIDKHFFAKESNGNDAYNKVEESLGSPEILSPEGIQSPGVQSPMTAPSLRSKHRKSRFSLSFFSQFNLKEFENIAAEIVQKGKVLGFTSFEMPPPSPTKEKGPHSLRSNRKGSLNEKRRSIFLPNTVRSSASEFSSLAFREVTRYFHCRVEIKKYEDRILKVVVMNEVSAPTAEEASSSQKRSKPIRRNAIKRRLMPLTIDTSENQIIPEQTGQESPLVPTAHFIQSAKTAKGKTGEFNFTEANSEGIEAISRADEEDAIPSECNFSYESERTGDEFEIPNFDTISARRRSQRLNVGLNDRSKSSPMFKVTKVYGSEPDNTSSQTESSSEMSSNANTPVKLNIRPSVLETVRRGMTFASKHGPGFNNIHDSGPSLAHSNMAQIINLDSNISSGSKLNFNVKDNTTNENGGDDVETIDFSRSKHSTSKVGLKHHAKLGHFDLAEQIPSLKFYRFIQSKIAFMWLTICIISFLGYNINILSDKATEISVFRESTIAFRSAMDQAFYITLMSGYLAKLAFMTSGSSYNETLQSVQDSINRVNVLFDGASMSIIERVGFFDTSLRHHLFDKNVKFLTFELEDQSTDYVMKDLFQSIDIIITHASIISKAPDLEDGGLIYSLSFLLENILNDVLIRIGEERSLIFEEANRANNDFVLIFILTVITFSLGTLAAIGGHIKSYFETKRFLKHFTYYNQSDISPIITNINLYGQLLDSHMSGQSLLTIFKARDHFANAYNGKDDKSRIVDTQKLGYYIYRRISIIILILLTPIIPPLTLQTILKDSIATVNTSINHIAEKKDININGLLLVVQTALYAVRPDVLSNNMEMSIAINSNFNDITSLLSDANLNVGTEEYALLHGDFCEYVYQENYQLCKSIMNQVSTAGVTGATLTLQNAMMTISNAISGGTYISNQSQADIFEALNTYILVEEYINEAIGTFEEQQEENVWNKLQKLNSIITGLIWFSVGVFLLMMLLLVVYVYFPSVRERESLCRIMLLFPARMIMLNKPLRLFLIKNSSSFSESLKQRYV